MIELFERKHVVGSTYQYVINEEEQILASKTLGGMLLFSGNGFSLELLRWSSNLQWEGNTSSREAAIYTIGENTGYLYDCGTKGKRFFDGIYFWKIVYGGVVYEAYEVGFGRKGIYLCIYADKFLIAIVSKKMVSKYFESSYKIYSEKKLSRQVLYIFVAYWDFAKWYPESTYESHTLNTWQKELKNKYDPTFIPRIEAMMEESNKEVI